MAYSEDFIDYNRRYLELRDIFEFLFPISRDGKNLSKGARSHNVFLSNRIIDGEIEECLDYFSDLDFLNFDLVRKKHILSEKKERSFIEHNSYKIKNELWYNLIFTLYRKRDGETFRRFRVYADNVNGKTFSQTLQEVFEKADIVNYFSMMDKLMPFSTLGFWLYLRYQPYTEEKGFLPAPVVFHGKNPRLGGLQDILYQISFAIQRQLKVYINKIGPFKLKKIIYEDISLIQEKNNPYIVAETRYNGNRQQEIKIYIQGDMDLKICEITDNKYESLDKAEKSGAVKVLYCKDAIRYHFYLISNKEDITNDYLLNKVEQEGRWFDADAYGTIKKLTKAKKLDYDFKYYNYGGKKNWDVFLFDFCVKKKEQASFERWADSFGNFAVLEEIGNKPAPEELYLYFPINTNTKARYIENERCMECGDFQAHNFINCEKCDIWKDIEYEHKFPTLLMEENSYRNLNNEQISMLELQWFLYAVKRCPNFTKVFLCASKMDGRGNLDLSQAGKCIEKGISCIQRYMKKEGDYSYCERAENNPFPAFKNEAVPDLNSSHCEKFHAVMEGIKRKYYYQCDKQSDNTGIGKHNEILPYAVSFDTVNYNPDTEKGISIMAYDLVQKRVIAVPFKNFTYGKSEGESDGIIEYRYRKYDKLYYFCSYFYKLYQADEKNACMMAELITHKPFPKGIYDETRDVNFKDELKRIKRPDICLLFENSINPWLDYAENSRADTNQPFHMEHDLKNNGISLFTEKEISYKRMVGKTILYFLSYEKQLYVLMNDSICKELISGDTSEAMQLFIQSMIKQDINLGSFWDKEVEILNEIQYINSVLKIHELVFCLKKENPDPDDIVLIYDYFRNYNCAGRENQGRYYFKVQFEGFEYRKIHEILLSLNSMIEIPAEAKDAKFTTHYISKESLAYMEQLNQSRLLKYRAAEGKEDLKKAVMELVAN